METEVFEYKHIECEENIVNFVIEVYQNFYWEVVGTQTVVSKESHLEEGGIFESDKVYSVTTEERFVTIDFKRGKNRPNLEEIKSIEREYLGGMNVITKEALTNRMENLKKELAEVEASLSKNLHEVGATAYSLFIKGETEVEDKNVQEVFHQIKSIDDEINSFTHQIEDIKAQETTGGFLSRLKDKASSTMKIAKIKLGIRSKREEKEKKMPAFGAELYSCYKKGVSTPSTLQNIWDTIDMLKEVEERKKEAYSFLSTRI